MPIFNRLLCVCQINLAFTQFVIFSCCGRTYAKLLGFCNYLKQKYTFICDSFLLTLSLVFNSIKISLLRCKCFNFLDPAVDVLEQNQTLQT